MSYDIYLLDNKIPLKSERDFETDYHEHPGWNSTMSKNNRGLSKVRTGRFLNYSGSHTLDNGWGYKASWIKKLIPVENTTNE